MRALQESRYLASSRPYEQGADNGIPERTPSVETARTLPTKPKRNDQYGDANADAPLALIGAIHRQESGGGEHAEQKCYAPPGKPDGAPIVEPENQEQETKQRFDKNSGQQDSCGVDLHVSVRAPRESKSQPLADNMLSKPE